MGAGFGWPPALIGGHMPSDTGTPTYAAVTNIKIKLFIEKV